MQFLKTFIASLLGTILGLFLLFLILFAVLVSSSSESEPYIRANTVLTVSLSGDIPVRPSDDPFEELFSPDRQKVSLEGLKNNLRKAAADDNIGAVWVQTNHVTAPWGNLETAYSYFEEYKESGKPLYFSTDDIGMNEKAYYLATLADSVFSPPYTGFNFEGFVAQMSFYRPMLDKIGVEPEIFRVGRYKSAVEPFLNETSSPESREQLGDILTTATDTFVEAVAKRTGKSHEEIHELMNTRPVDRVNFALENGLIDALAFEDEVEALIKKRLEIDEDRELRTVSFARYSRVSASRAGLDEPGTNDKIAVIYASGMILPEIADSPFGTTSGIFPTQFKRQLDSALDDDDVKSIVIHIDSPGGAATSSDLLWHSIKQATDKKPVVASFGSVAASGGYYMAMGADTVLAGENTITGSIGIFSLLFNAQELMTEKIGIRYETMKTHQYADLYDLTRPFTPEEQRVIQDNIEHGYEVFLNRVAEGRGMTRDEAHEAAQGRVYTGQAAKDAGLVDLVGDINKALEVAAEMADIEEYTIDVYPRHRDLFERLLSSSDAKIRAAILGWMPENLMNEARNIHTLMQQPAGQNWALLPIRIDVN